MTDANPNTAENNDRTPLSWATVNGRSYETELLLSRNVNLNILYNNGWTPLSWPARKGDEIVVKLLLQKMLI